MFLISSLTSILGKSEGGMFSFPSGHVGMVLARETVRAKVSENFISDFAIYRR